MIVKCYHKTIIFIIEPDIQPYEKAAK